MEQCPRVLSLGRLVEEGCCTFHWVPGRCWITDPSGVEHDCDIRNFVPMMNIDATSMACCATREIKDLGDAMLALVGVAEKSKYKERPNEGAPPDVAVPADDGAPAEDASQEGQLAEQALAPPEPEEAPGGQEDVSARERERARAQSVAHLMGHFPKCNECAACVQAQIRAKYARRRSSTLQQRPEE